MAEMEILCKDGDNLYASILASEIVLAREGPQRQNAGTRIVHVRNWSILLVCLANDACMSQKHTYYMQQWFMDYSRASHVADDNGQRAFALVNKATG